MYDIDSYGSGQGHGGHHQGRSSKDDARTTSVARLVSILEDMDAKLGDGGVCANYRRLCLHLDERVMPTAEGLNANESELLHKITKVLFKGKR